MFDSISLFMLSKIGRRKNAIANALLCEGDGKIFINDLDLKTYMQYNPFCINLVKKPFSILGLEGKYRTTIKVSGGGLVGQAEASLLAIAPRFRKSKSILSPTFKKKGYLTQNAREKERRKYGLKKARKAPQFSKR
uniref:Small ribosomal subunit protein uS9c n=1 Tax=Bryopsis hypnoides TaxID=222885 RepID=D0EVR3_BRYHP|nr:30S ribosomal protein S9 [Bryopsis hypnoides]ACX33767.1 30S ribosomal protein S9 [Bryopsis hypnoides]